MMKNPTDERQVVAVIPAAGAGRRMGGEIPKLLLRLDGEPILALTLKALNIPEIEAFFLPAPLEGEEEIGRLARETLPGRAVFTCSGGRERQESVFAGLTAVAGWEGWRVPEEKRIILIHDAARPLIEAGAVRRVIEEAYITGAAGVGVPVKDTIKVVDGEGYILETPDRDSLWAIQTPQAFRLPIIWEAHLAARVDNYLGTDDCGLVERMGYPVRMVSGSYCNLKITTPEDLEIALALQRKKAPKMLRVGEGYDVHRLIPGRRLVLAGVEIPGEMGLEGHSDADVAIHAVMDALLGAAGMGDIGVLFPDHDPEFKDIDSRVLLRRVLERLKEAGFIPVNIDLTIIAQRPKIAPYRGRMKENLADTLGLSLSEINVKATTTEGLGFTGRGEGIAAQAVALVEKRVGLE